MKVLISLVLVFLTCFAASLATDCEIKGHEFNKDETYSPPGECIQYKCGGVGEMSALGCAASAAPDSCKYVPEDLKKPYPQCCPTYDC